MPGTDFKQNPHGPSTGGSRPPDYTRMTPPPREKPPMPAAGIPVPPGGKTPWKGPPLQPAKPYK